MTSVTVFLSRHKRLGSCLLLFGLGLSLLSLVFLANRAEVQSADGSSSYYDLQPGEGLSQVATRFGLSERTLRCANPDWPTASGRVVLPLSAARRHQVEAGQTLGEIARRYRVETGAITDYSLNFWAGCSQEAGLGGTEASAIVPVGTLLYIPDETYPVANSRLRLAPVPAQNGLPGGLAQSDSYGVAENSGAALANPYPLSFQLVGGGPTPLRSGPLVPVTGAVAVLVTPTPPSTAQPQPGPTSPPPSPGPTLARTVVTDLSGPSPAVASSVTLPTAQGKPLAWPIHGVLTTYFSATHPAIDLATRRDTPVLAAQAGVVFFASWSPYGYGNFVQLDHNDGRHTHYAHLNSIVVGPGQTVTQGQLLGYEGSTGNSTGPHLHFELVIDGRYVNPLLYLPPL